MNSFMQIPPQQAQLQPQAPIIEKFKELKRGYDPDKVVAPATSTSTFSSASFAAPTGGATQKNPDCKFIEIHYDYNQGNPAAPVKPSFVDQGMWDGAMQDNPDATTLNPQAVVGIKNLKERFNIIQKERGVFHDYFVNVSSQLETVKKKLQKNKLKFKHLTAKQAGLRHRFISVMKDIEVLRCRNHRLQPAEEDLREEMQTLEHLLRTQKAKLDALVLAQRDQVSNGNVRHAPHNDEKLLEGIHKAHVSIQQLRSILDKDRRDMEIIFKALGKKDRLALM